MSRHKRIETITLVEIKYVFVYCFSVSYCSMNTTRASSRTERAYYIFAVRVGSRDDGPYPVASTTLGIHQQVLLGWGSPM
jgi:hypothetical protein